MIISAFYRRGDRLKRDRLFLATLSTRTNLNRKQKKMLLNQHSQAVALVIISYPG